MIISRVGQKVGLPNTYSIGLRGSVLKSIVPCHTYLDNRRSKDEEREPPRGTDLLVQSVAVEQG